MYLYVHIFVSVDDSGGFVYCVTASCGPSLHECMSVYVHVCDCTLCVYFSCIYGSGVWSPQAGWAGSPPYRGLAWGGAGRDWTESLSH